MSIPVRKPEISDPDAEVRERLDSLTQALRAKDLDDLMAHYAPDTIVYDLQPPHQVLGREGYRKNFEAWFSSVNGSIGYALEDLHVTAGDRTAFVHYVAHVQSTRTTGGKADYWVRVTAGFEKREGTWLVTHEHISMPIRMKTMEATPSLQS
jgi:uncharacterized protein (TIGR02246 family)